MEIKKLLKSLNKVGTIEIWLIPHRISSKCILNAKSDLSKKRLVQAAIWSENEIMKRLHVPGYEYPSEDKKHNYKKPTSTFCNFIEGFFK